MAINGIAFPFQKGETEFPRKRVDDDVIEDNIRRILLTRRGERVMRPDSGSDTMSFVFESVGPILTAQISRECRRAIQQGEPRVQVQRVQVVTVNDARIQARQILVLITYEIQREIKKMQVRIT